MNFMGEVFNWNTNVYKNVAAARALVKDGAGPDRQPEVLIGFPGRPQGSLHFYIFPAPKLSGNGAKFILIYPANWNWIAYRVDFHISKCPNPLFAHVGIHR
jgi:hypothetical protein